ncbi:MAG: N-acetyl sugar amidotransferase [Bacteroidetes bacterium]|nr:N-acetyl sugar amidotransferase [Bacteroidota bacterium]
MANITSQRCVNCVMDTTDPNITFDDDGLCNHCHSFSETKKDWFPNDIGKEKLASIINQVKYDGRNNEYNCILGLSGGIDSSYLAIKIEEFGLRPLVVHVDGGWNSELAVYNIEKIVKYCNYDLQTIVIDWEEMRDLQNAYLKSGIANQDVPQDHIFFSSLYHYAVKNNIKYIFSGGNIATESVVVDSWHHSAMDSINLKAIHKKYGQVKLENYKTINAFQYYIGYPYYYKMKTVRPLNYMPYRRDAALRELQEKVGYKDYGRKHGESVFTRFFQNYLLPEKFGYDKRLIHLSSEILSGQTTREEALNEIGKPLYDGNELTLDMRYISKKLGLEVSLLDSICKSPGKEYWQYNNWDFSYKILKRIQRLVEKILKRKLSNYS